MEYAKFITSSNLNKPVQITTCISSTNEFSSSPKFIIKFRWNVSDFNEDVNFEIMEELESNVIKDEKEEEFEILQRLEEKEN